jgi:O-antigen/teichoic acid export membrane protein
MLKTGLLLTAGNSLTALMGLMRNIIIARMVSVEDFGIASTLAITVAFVEMTSNIALDRLIVQARDSHALQSTAQLLQVIRGAVTALLLYLLASPIATLFGMPELTWCFELLALVPLLRGFMHLDMYRLQREMKFYPSIFVELASIAASTTVAFPVALWLGDFRVMLVAILLQHALFVILSHVVAKQSYRWDWNTDAATHVLQFGWPLLLNGLLMFGAFHGDRIIIGSLIGLKELGLFSAALALTLPPSLVIAKTLSWLLLPQLSKVNAEHATLEALASKTFQLTLVICVINALVFASIGPIVMALLYGEKYQDGASLLVFLAVLQSCRLAKAGPAIIAISVAETKNPMIANIVRVLALPVAWTYAQAGGDMFGVIAIAIVGEVIGYVVSIFLLKGFSPRRYREFAVVSLISIAVIVWMAFSPLTGTFLALPLLWWSAGTILGLTAFFVVARELRQYASSTFIKWRKRAAQ